VALTLGVALLMAACVSLRPDADPFLTRAEQSLAVAVDTLDAVFYLERMNEATLEGLVPGTHAAVERLRARAPDIINGLTAALDAYRAAPSDGTKASVQSYLALLQALAVEAQAYIVKWEGGGS